MPKRALALELQCCFFKKKNRSKGSLLRLANVRADQQFYRLNSARTLFIFSPTVTAICLTCWRDWRDEASHVVYLPSGNYFCRFWNNFSFQSPYSLLHHIIYLKPYTSICWKLCLFSFNIRTHIQTKVHVYLCSQCF